MNTLCRVERGSDKISLAMLPSPSMSGVLHVARVNNIAQSAGAGGDRFVSYWVELRHDVLTFVKNDSQSRGRGLSPIRVAFSTAVDPPPPALCKAAETRALASKLMTKKYLAVYSPGNHAIWLECRSQPGELQRWQKVSSAAPKLKSCRCWLRADRGKRIFA
jgi:hypothetical protein